MQKLLTGILAMFVGVFLCAGSAQAAVAQTHVVDVTKPLKASLTLNTGDRVVFVKPMNWVGSDIKISFEFDPAPRGRTAKPLQAEKVAQAVTNGYLTLASYKVVNAGAGDFVVTYKVVAPGGRVREERIKFTSQISRQVSADAVEGKNLLR